MKRVIPIALAAAIGLIAAGSGDDWQPTSASAKRHAAGADATKLKLKRSPYGRVLFANGYAMYVFTKDGRKSRCYADCAEAWPPLLKKGRIEAGRRVKRRLIGTVTRRDGSRQVTYKGKPLYGYVHDPRGEVLCHDVREFGGKWYAVLRSGERAPT